MCESVITSSGGGLVVSFSERELKELHEALSVLALWRVRLRRYEVPTTAYPYITIARERFLDQEIGA